MDLADPDRKGTHSSLGFAWVALQDAISLRFDLSLRFDQCRFFLPLSLGSGVSRMFGCNSETLREWGNGARKKSYDTRSEIPVVLSSPVHICVDMLFCFLVCYFLARDDPIAVSARQVGWLFSISWCWPNGRNYWMSEHPRRNLSSIWAGCNFNTIE